MFLFHVFSASRALVEFHYDYNENTTIGTLWLALVFFALCSVLHVHEEVGLFNLIGAKYLSHCTAAGCR